MSRPEEDRFRAAVARYVREEQPGEHLPMNRLVAHHRGELTPAETAEVADHLALCSACTERLLDAAEFLDDDEEVDAEAVSGPGLPPRRPSVLHSLSFAYGLAAAFAVLALGLGLFGRGSGVPALRPNEAIYDLAPAGSQRAELAEETEIRLPGPESSACLILNPSAVPTAPRHGVRFRGVNGRVVWQNEGFRPQALDTFRLGLTAGALPPGRYTIELYGLRDGHEEPLGTYRITLRE